MDTSYPPQALYYLNDALSCLLYIAGIVAGVLLIIRRRTLPGVLTTIGFLFFGLSLIISIIGWDILGPGVENYGALNWGIYCLTTPLNLLGLIGLVVMVFMLIGKKEKLPPSPKEE
jgi:hypothetical protein